MKKENLNSIITFFNSTLPHLTQSREMVLEAIYELENATDEHIAQHLGIGINHISGRVGELKELKLLKCEDIHNSAGNRCRICRLNPNYKTEATEHQIEKFGLEKAQSQLRPEVRERIQNERVNPKLW